MPRAVHGKDKDFSIHDEKKMNDDGEMIGDVRICNC
jgi:hypothetical protein